MTRGFWGYGMRGLTPPAVGLSGESKAASVERELKRLEDRLDRLTLACMALWSLLQEKTDLTEPQLLERMEELDLADGKADGKVTRQVQVCTNCGRKMSPRHSRCIYCGTEKLAATAFDQTL